MTIFSKHSLRTKNTFKFPASALSFYQIQTLDELAELSDMLSAQNFYILGEGSNTLFIDQEIACVIHPKFKGVEVVERDADYLVKAYAGENWHNFVVTLIDTGICGLENLALIPGSVGAAPVQNIGAYGVELSDFCHAVSWYNFKSKSLEVISNTDCEFGYRDSVFKQRLKNDGIIISVEFCFPKDWSAKLSYVGLNHLPENSSALDIMNQVIALREAKLPDPKVIANAGSFFKNPVLSPKKFAELSALFPTVPNYPQPNGSVKVAAGWLIEHAGLKGFELSGVGVHKKQALVLVNYESDNSKSLVELARIVVKAVSDKFGIQLEPEVRFVGFDGEVNSLEVVTSD